MCLMRLELVVSAHKPMCAVIQCCPHIDGRSTARPVSLGVRGGAWQPDWGTIWIESVWACSSPVRIHIESESESLLPFLPVRALPGVRVGPWDKPHQIDPNRG